MGGVAHLVKLPMVTKVGGSDLGAY
jgi:hypothetical protein